MPALPIRPVRGGDVPAHGTVDELQSLIGHRRGAVEMAEAKIDNGVNTSAVTIAHDIVATRQAAIDQMTKMMGG
jgi:uncharacterized protein (DUF305 family)